jgi:putative spermidine/putrescine transport system permease protein
MSTAMRRRAPAGDIAAQLLFGTVLVAGAALLLVPAGIVVLMSFSNDTYLSLPPDSFGLRQYETLFTSPTWGPTLRLSLELASVTSLLSIALAVPTSLVLNRSRLRGRFLIESAALVALILPVSAYAVALYGVFAQLGLLATFHGLVIANLVVSFPLTFLVINAALANLPRELELAAMTMGAGRLRAWTTVTVRLLLPAIVAGGLMAFITSFDEAVFVNFLGGPGLVTLPKAIFDSVRYEIDPVITAIATVVMVATGLLLAVVSWLRKGFR